MDEINKIHHLNFLDNQLPDKCADIIIADPPYFEVLGSFDFIWDNFEEYLQDVEKWAAECTRLLKDNGTLFWWGHAKKIAYSQIIIDKYLNLLSNAVWEKTDCRTRKNAVGELRSFAPVTERLLVYDKGEDFSGLDMIHADPELFKTIKIMFDDWLEKSGLTLKEAITKIGSSATHWLGFSKRPKTQFNFPTPEKWAIMEKIQSFPVPFSEARSSYDHYREEYEALREEYEELRRPFNLPFMVTDVLNYSQESHITGQFDHDTKKPPTLTRLLIEITSKRDALVVVPFAGSGTECAVAIENGRNFVSYEIDEKHHKTASKRVEDMKQKRRQKDIFDLGA